ncbi:MarR family transcriptional regulator [Nonomuraea sp. GTA35]|uniref:MarR family transcriptional regulator n=1 Tax=Nonomuraea sp. GTA35 TaxID=1676746 RepID=UPI0035C20050
MTRMAARVLACLYITDSGTLTAAELVQRLHVSPASISHTVAFLEQQGLIKRERVPGGRRDPGRRPLRRRRRVPAPRERDPPPSHGAVAAKPVRSERRAPAVSSRGFRRVGRLADVRQPRFGGTDQSPIYTFS